MFEYYGKTDKFQDLSRKKLDTIFQDLFKDGLRNICLTFYDLRLKKRMVLRKKRNIQGLEKGTYQIDAYLRNFTDVYWLFMWIINLNSTDKFLSAKDGTLFFLIEGRKWFVKEVAIKDFLEVFPKGVPQTEREMEQWISYVGYKALMDAKSRVNVG